MDPKDLAKAFQDRAAQEAARAETEKNALANKKAEFERLSAAGQQAMKDVVIPYLTEVRDAMNGNFSFEISREATSHVPMIATFTVKGQKPVSIRLQGSAINVLIKGGPGPLGGVNYARITVPSDLTREKLGILIDEIIKE